MANNSHADRKVARRKMVPVFSLGDALNLAEMKREQHLVLALDGMEDGDFPTKRAARFDEGEREPS